MKKAADDMKREQEKKAEERKRILAERIGSPGHSGASDAGENKPDKHSPSP